MTKHRFLHRAVAALSFALSFIVAAPAALAEDVALSATVATEHATNVLSLERAGLSPGETTWAVFQQTLEDGWHVYWENPGDSGLPLEFKWRLPAGVTAGDIVYPTPERVPAGPFVNFGHHGAPVFLAPLTVAEDARLDPTTEIALDATWLICEEICVPESASFTLRAPADPGAAFVEPVKALADAARAVAPAPYESAAAVHFGGDVLTLAVEGPAASSDGEAFFFPAADGLIEPSAAQTTQRVDGRLIIALAPGPTYDAAAPASVDGVLALFDGDERRAVRLTAQPTTEPIAAALNEGAPAVGSGGANGHRDAERGAANIFLLLAAAFLGGTILNVMPCVFPIIFVKAASFVGAADRGLVREHGLIYTAGVVATFAALGGALLVLRAGGEQLGWGFHLQSPWVVAASAYVLFAVGLNLAGVFSVGESLQNVGSDLAAQEGRAGAFFTGVLAVFVAAPCIGPLLSAPMGAAVLLPPLAGMAIFVAMALGLAAPYLAVSLSPALARRLPRPGAWMTVLKQGLSFPVFGAAAFFLWVLAQQTGPTGLAVGLSGAVLLAVAAWAYERSKSGRLSAPAQALAAIALLAAVIPAARLELAPPETSAAKKGGYGALQAATFDPAAIETARAAGRGVFVDFTAAWCVTCQVNKATVLSRRSVADLFERADVSLMAADWTRRDPTITDALAAFGANGVPLYVYYPPVGEPRVLPLPLTEAAIRRQLQPAAETS